MIVLAGDIGGTKTHLGLFRVDQSLTMLRDHVYATRDFPSLEAVLSDFLGGDASIECANLGVPGPVIDGVAHGTNIPWDVRERSIASALHGVPARLVNDLEATAYGMVHLGPSELVELQAGERRLEPCNIAVIAAGTGLGEAGMIAESGGWHAVASEGGHADFAPRGAEQIALLGFLEREFGHASFERVLSGPGLCNIYRFLLENNHEPEPQWLADSLRHGDPAAVISQAALAGTDGRCVHAMEIFIDVYGAEAANLTLKFLALGGVYLGGGIAPKILPFLQNGRFMRAFLNKGRLNATLERIAVRVSLNQNTALIGAAHLAASMGSPSPNSR